MEYFCSAVTIVAFIYLSGLGLMLTFIRRPSWPQLFLATPWVGYCYLIFAAWNVYFFGGVISRSWLAAFSIIPLLCLIYALYRLRPSFRLSNALVGSVGAILLAAASFAVISYSIIGAHSGLTTVSLGNHDIVLYASISRFLTEFSRGSAEGLNRIFVLTMDYNYFGAPSFAAITSVLLNTMPHQITSLSVDLFLPFTACGACLLLRDTFNFEWKTSLIGLVLVVFHPILQYTLLHGFSSQIIGIGLSLMMFWAWSRLKQRSGWSKYKSGYFVLFSLFTLGQFLTYQHMLPFVWFFIAIYAGAQDLGKGLAESFRSAFDSVCSSLAAFLVAGAVCPERLIALYATLHGTGLSPGGWFLPYPTPDYLLGLIYTNIFFGIRPWQIWLPASTITCLFISLVVAKAYRHGHQSVLSLAAACLSIVAGSLVLGLSDRQNNILGGYRAFKLIAFFLPFFSIVVASFFSRDLVSSRSASIAIRIIALGIFLHADVIADSALLNTVAHYGPHIDPQKSALLKVDYDPEIKSINILGSNWWSIMSNAYFLLHKTLSFETGTYFPATKLSGEYDLLDSEDLTTAVTHSGILKVYYPYGTRSEKDDDTAAERSDRFHLVKHSRFEDILSARLSTGWWSSEGSHIWTGHDGKRSSILLVSAEEANVEISLSYAAFQPGDRVTVEFGGRRWSGPHSAGKDDLQQLDVPKLKLQKGNNELFLVSEFEPTQPSGDPRTLSCSFREIAVKVLHKEEL